LHVEIEARIDAKTLLVELATEAAVELLADPLDVVRRDLTRLGAGRELERERLGEAGVGVAQPAVATHQLDHRVAPLNGELGVLAGVVACRSLGKRGEDRRLGNGDIACRLAEVALRSRLDAVGAAAEVDLVEVELEDLVLAVAGLDRTRDLHFLQLADERLLARDAVGKDVARELHGDRREPLHELAGDHVANAGPEDAAPIDTGVFVEALVLGDDERVAEVLRDVAELDEGAALEPDLGDEPTVDGIELGRLARSVLVQHVDRRTAALSADEGPRSIPATRGERDAEGEQEEECAGDARVLADEPRGTDGDHDALALHAGEPGRAAGGVEGSHARS
jgi:hypothetical protein